MASYDQFPCNEVWKKTVEKMTDDELKGKALAMLQYHGFDLKPYLPIPNPSRETLIAFLVELESKVEEGDLERTGYRIALVNFFLQPDKYPDPAWDYFKHWRIANNLREVEMRLDIFLNKQDDATPEIDAELREYYREIQSFCIRGLGMLPEEIDD